MKIFRRLFFQLIGSWSVTPLAFLFAQALGEGNNYYIKLFLLLGSFTGGVSLFLNEILAPVYSVTKLKISVYRFMAFCASYVGILLLLTSYFTNYGLPNYSNGFWLGPLILPILTGSILVSFLSSELLYSGIAAHPNLFSKRKSFVVGFIPTAATQVIIIFLTISASSGLEKLSIFWFSLLLISPSLAQYFYLRSIKLPHKRILVSGNGVKFSIMNTGVVFILLTAIALLGAVAKISLSSLSSGYSNLMFLGLNMLTSVVMIFCKSSFIASGSAVLNQPSKNDFVLGVAAIIVSINLLLLISTRAEASAAAISTRIFVVGSCAVIGQLLIVRSRLLCIWLEPQASN